MIFRNHNLTIYSIKTYSPHDVLTVGIFYRKKMKLFRWENEENVEEVLSFLKEHNLGEESLQKINEEIRKDSL